jgi:glycine cleavage system H protein
MKPVARTPRDDVRFQRSRFVARFPREYLYSPAHFWLCPEESGRWRIGFTSFATRMLGEIVEFDFEVAPGAVVAVGQVIGWAEGFKATTDLFSVATGSFAGANPTARGDAARVCADPYGLGWLYAVDGEPDPQATDVQTYLDQLGETIDRMAERPWQPPELA